MGEPSRKLCALRTGCLLALSFLARVKGCLCTCIWGLLLREQILRNPGNGRTARSLPRGSRCPVSRKSCLVHGQSKSCLRHFFDAAGFVGSSTVLENRCTPYAPRTDGAAESEYLKEALFYVSSSVSHLGPVFPSSGCKLNVRAFR